MRRLGPLGVLLLRMAAEAKRYHAGLNTTGQGALRILVGVMPLGTLNIVIAEPPHRWLLSMFYMGAIFGSTVLMFGYLCAKNPNRYYPTDIR